MSLKKIFHAMLVRIWKGTESLENSLVGSYKVKHTLNLRLRIFTHGCLPKKKNEMNICSCKDLCTNVYNSFFHHSHKLETTQISINWGVKKKLWHVHTVDYCSAIKNNKLMMWQQGWISNALWQMKSDTKDYRLYDSIDMSL